MKIAIFIILYIIGVISSGVCLYKELKTKSLVKKVETREQLFIVLISLVFPITYLLGVLMIIIGKIGDKLCKDQ